jgi:hypothetical protein
MRARQTTKSFQEQKQEPPFSSYRMMIPLTMPHEVEIAKPTISQQPIIMSTAEPGPSKGPSKPDPEEDSDVEIEGKTRFHCPSLSRTDSCVW